MIRPGYYTSPLTTNITNPIQVKTPVGQAGLFDLSDLSATVDIGMLNEALTRTPTVADAFVNATASTSTAKFTPTTQKPQMLLSAFTPRDLHVVTSDDSSELIADRQFEKAIVLFEEGAYEDAYAAYQAAVANYRNALEPSLTVNGNTDDLNIKLAQALLGQANSVFEGTMETLNEIDEGATVVDAGQRKIRDNLFETLRLSEEVCNVAIQLEASPNLDVNRMSFFLHAQAMQAKATVNFNMDTAMGTRTAELQLKHLEQAEALYDASLSEFPPDSVDFDITNARKKLIETLSLHGQVLNAAEHFDEALVAHQDALDLIELTLREAPEDYNEEDIYDIHAIDLEVSELITDTLTELDDFERAIAYAKHYRDALQWIMAYHEQKGHTWEVFDRSLSDISTTELIIQLSIMGGLTDEHTTAHKVLETDLLAIWKSVAGNTDLAKKLFEHISEAINELADLGKVRHTAKAYEQAVSLFEEAIYLRRFMINISDNKGLIELRRDLIDLLQSKADAEKLGGFDANAIDSYLDQAYLMQAMINEFNADTPRPKIRKAHQQLALLLEYLVLPLLRKYGRYREAAVICEDLLAEYDILKDTSSYERVATEKQALLATAEEQGAGHPAKVFMPNVSMFRRRSVNES